MSEETPHKEALQCEENEGFLSIFLGAGCSLREAPTVVVPVIVLGSKDK
jgi:hypothetical protein